MFSMFIPPLSYTISRFRISSDAGKLIPWENSKFETFRVPESHVPESKRNGEN